MSSTKPHLEPAPSREGQIDNIYRNIRNSLYFGILASLHLILTDASRVWHMKTLLKKLTAMTLPLLLLPVTAEAAVNFHFRVPAKGLTGVAPWGVAPPATFWPVSMAASGSGGETTIIGTPNGDVYTKGENFHGELGDGGSPYGWTGQFSRSAPASLTGGAAKVFSGTYQSYIIATDGSLWFAGYNRSGEGGVGSTTDVLRWTKVPGLSNVVKVAGKANVTFAVKSDGTLWSSGSNFATQRGMSGGTAANSTTFQQVPPPTGAGRIVDIATPRYPNTAIALDSNGNVFTTGNNQFGTLGDGSSTATEHGFAQVPFFSGNAIAVAADEYAVAVLTNDGTVYTAGYNYGSQFDTGRGSSGNVFTQFGSLATGMQKLMGGNKAIAAVGVDGKVYSTSLGGDQAPRGTAGFYPWSVTGFSTVGAGNPSWMLKPDGSLWIYASGDTTFSQYMFQGY